MNAEISGQRQGQEPHPEDTFTHRYVPALGRRVHRLGLAGNYGLGADGLRRALDMGPEYVFWTPRMSEVTAPLREALAKDREKYVIATGPTLGFMAGSLSRVVDKARRLLKTDYLDILQLFWLGKTSSWRPSVVKELVQLRESGVVRRIGTSIHDRVRAGKLAEDSPLDMLMIRYNAAHPGAETDIFPHLAKRKPAVVAYTATAWGKLLKTPEGWQGPAATAGDCYRFSLSSPHVDIVLTGPANLAQFEENLRALAQGPLSEEEMARMRSLGQKARQAGGRLRWMA